jgi:hypothetical protein
MKKKIVLIAAVILVSLGLLNISKIVQDKYLNKNIVSIEQKANDKTPKEVNIKETDKLKPGAEKDTHEEAVKPKIKEETLKANVESKTVTEQKNGVDIKTEIKAPSTANVKDVTKEQVTKSPEPKKEPNFIIKDDISGKIILSINISTENKTAGQVTLNELDKNGISYRASGRGETVYFTMINNLKARDYGHLSGWCYYVNGSKASISCGAYKLKPGDVVEWKYLKDGVNN